MKKPPKKKTISLSLSLFLLKHRIARNEDFPRDDRENSNNENNNEEAEQPSSEKARLRVSWDRDGRR
jgi:hypothetical protein